VVFSLRDNPDILTQIDWQALAIVVLIGVPVTAVVNASEFVVSARMVGVNFPLLRSMNVTIIGSAANMLPLPGATMVRIAALKVSGVGFKKSAAVTLFVALVWIGSSFFYAGVMLAQFEAGLLAWGMGLAGFAVLVLSAWATQRSNAHIADYGKIVVLKFAMVLIDAGRIYFCFLALGLDVAFAQASAFVVSSVLGSAVSIVPAGLGVREVVSAGLAPIVGVAISAGFLSATLNRIAGLSALLPIAGVLMLLDRNQKEAQP
jgi:uncharacterized membrane protein YbhN (UPF0104 family)